MNLLEKELQKINFIVHQYQDEQKNTYGKATEAIEEKLKKITSVLSKRFGLTSSTSVKEIKYFSFISRVKDQDSFREKLIRNNLFSNFSKLIPDGFDPENGELILSIKNELINCDDLIGIKILADLNKDCAKIYEMLGSNEFYNLAKAQNIILNEDDMKKQPQEMRNGLAIYKMKGVYDKYNFELQIKSKIISAWGDMEHSIFYKDYTISPIRDSSQSAMNHIGMLLFQIDDFLESVRGANQNYRQNSDALNFMQWFSDNYSTNLKDLLGNGYKIDGISELLFAVYKKVKETGMISSTELRINHFEFPLTNQTLEKFAKIRNGVYDLKILEAIVIDWIVPKGTLIDPSNIDKFLGSYLTILSESTAAYLCARHGGFDFDEMLKLVKDLYKLGIDFCCNERFLLNLEKLSEYLNACHHIKDLSDSKLEDSFVVIFEQILFVRLNKGEVQRQIDLLENKEDFRRSLSVLIELTDNAMEDSRIKLNDIARKIIEIV